MDNPRVDDTYSDSHPQLTTLTAPSTTTSVMDMPTYSQVTAAVTSYAHDLHSSGHPTHYYSEFDWQHGSAAAASDPSHGSFYSLAERPDLASVQLYHTFPSAVPHTDIYSASPTLWHGPPGLLEDSSHAGALASQRFLPGMPRASPSSATSPVLHFLADHVQREAQEAPSAVADSTQGGQHQGTPKDVPPEHRLRRAPQASPRLQLRKASVSHRDPALGHDLHRLHEGEIRRVQYNSFPVNIDLYSRLIQ